MSTEISTDVSKRAVTVRQTLETMRPQLAMALPRHLTADRLIRVAMTAVQNTPKLLECDRTSLLSAIMTCAQLGLEPDGILGQAYLIPFKVKGQMRCQFIPGYKGLIALARNSGEVMGIMAQAVYERDEFDYEFGLNQKLSHRPARGDRGEITYFYAIAEFKDGGRHWDVMTREEVERIRDGSQGYQSAKKWAKDGVINSPWVSHFEEMGKKTVIRRISKYLPMDVQKAAFIAASYDTGKASHLDASGDVIVLNAAEEEDGTPAKQIEGRANTLDKFAEGDAIDQETGEVITNLSPAASAALAALTACTTEAALDDLWERTDIEFCREIGADRLEEIRARLIHNQAAAAGQKDLLP